MKKPQLTIQKPTKEDVDAIRLLVNAREDFQALRIRMDNRIGRKGSYRVKREKDEDGFDKYIAMSVEEQDIEERPLRSEDLESFAEIANHSKWMEVSVEEKLNEMLNRFPIYTEFLKDVKGIGPIACANLIGMYDIHIADTVSKMKQFGGLNASQTRGKKWVKVKEYDPSMGDIVREKEQKDGTKLLLVKTFQMVKADGYTAGYILPFNKRLRTVLVKLAADGILKASLRWQPIAQEDYDRLPENMRSIREKKIDGAKVADVPCQAVISSKYVLLYMEYKWRLKNREDMVDEKLKGGKIKRVMWKDATDGHQDRAARRYMMEHFLQDLYDKWRRLEGLSVREPYQQEYLGHKHSA